MSENLPRITNVEPVINGVLKMIFLDSYEGVVDLRPVIARQGIFEWIADVEHYKSVRVAEYGHSLGWIDGEEYKIDLSADGLRRDCERQEQIHQLMVG